MNKNFRLSSQSGVMLLEALIAIFIFSLGILAVVGMQAIAAKQVTDAQYRSQASLLADQLFGQMWATTDRTVASLQTSFSSDGASAGQGYVSWSASVTRTLPAVGFPPRVAISPDGTAVVDIYWHPPSESANAAPHKYTVVAKIF